MQVHTLPVLLAVIPAALVTWDTQRYLSKFLIHHPNFSRRILYYLRLNSMIPAGLLDILICIVAGMVVFLPLFWLTAFYLLKGL